MRPTRILVLMHEDFVPPDSIEGLSDKEMAPWKTEFDVVTTLKELGHDARPLGVATELGTIRDAVLGWKPRIVVNLLEEFHGHGVYVPYVLGYLELLRQPYTGCNPHALILTHSKAMTKKILRYHRVPAPDFAMFPRNRRVRRPKRLDFPLIVKSATAHGSVGIAQASIVHDDEKLNERVQFVHDRLLTDAIAEEYIDGRELYVGVIGNHRLQTLPIWEMKFNKLSDGAPPIATEKVKWDLDYQEKVGVTTDAAANLSDGTAEHIRRLSKRIYRLLGLSGYARIDFRLTEEGKVYLLEANPNPQLAYGEDFAESAHAQGIPYEKLIDRILHLGMRYKAEWKT